VKGSTDTMRQPRPRPRQEGGGNPALKPQPSPYGDGARLVPKKLGGRGEAATRLLGKMQKKG
jgi:hypothetical protein